MFFVMTTMSLRITLSGSLQKTHATQFFVAQAITLTLVGRRMSISLASNVLKGLPHDFMEAWSVRASRGKEQFLIGFMSLSLLMLPKTSTGAQRCPFAVGLA